MTSLTLLDIPQDIMDIVVLNNGIFWNISATCSKFHLEYKDQIKKLRQIRYNQDVQKYYMQEQLKNNIEIFDYITIYYEGVEYYIQQGEWPPQVV